MKTKLFLQIRKCYSILQNLISNALRHTRPGGINLTTAKANEDKLIIKVKDNVGMSEKTTKPLIK
jgi:signal transduction histidine kinase